MANQVVSNYMAAIGRKGGMKGKGIRSLKSEIASLMGKISWAKTEKEREGLRAKIRELRKKQ